MDIDKEKTRDILIGIVSLLFIILILYLYVNKTLINYYENTDSSPLQVYNLSSPTQYQCTYYVDRPTIILRFDDIRAYSVQTKPLVKELVNRNMSATLAVIPRDLESDSEMINFLKSLKGNTRIEIAQHGLYHNSSDDNLSPEELLTGKSKLKSLLLVEPVTYIPPYNLVTPTLFDGVQRNYRVLSAGSTIFKEGKVAQIGGGYSIESHLLYDNTTLPTNEAVLSSCESQLKSFNLCVITFHPQEYSSTPSHATDMNQTKFKQYQELLTGIKRLNATTKTFKDIVYCIPTNDSVTDYSNYTLPSNQTSPSLEDSEQIKPSIWKRLLEALKINE